METLAKLAVYVLAACLMFRLSRDGAGGRYPWTRILLSLLLISVIVEAAALTIRSDGLGTMGKGEGIAVIVSIALLSFLWGPVIAHHLGFGLSHFMFVGSAEYNKGIRPDFRAVRSFIKDEEFERARELVERELTKDEKNYEGRLLLAEIHCALKRPDLALKEVDVILNNPEAMPAQKEIAQKNRDYCLQLARHVESLKPSES